MKEVSSKADELHSKAWRGKDKSFSPFSIHWWSRQMFLLDTKTVAQIFKNDQKIT